MRIVALLVIVVAVAGCGRLGGPDEPVDGGATPPEPGDAPVLVIVEGDPGGPGLSVREALTHGPNDDIVSVTGALLVAADGTARLCDAIAESFPPQCGGARIDVTGLDLEDLGLEEANGVRWAVSVTLLGSVE
ncbi:MAG: hypothetical protein ACRDFY_05695 [Candidatus Limnocylindria bacterium]